MNGFVELTIKELKEKYLNAICDLKTDRDEVTIIINLEDIARVCRFLHDDKDLAYDYLSDLCGVDYLGQNPRFEVVYHLYSMKNKCRIRLKVRVPEGAAVPSVTSIWRGANWEEREVFDMFGIEFSGHPELSRILMPDDWEGHPLRKDYPLEGYTPPKWNKADRPW